MQNEFRVEPLWRSGPYAVSVAVNGRYLFLNLSDRRSEQVQIEPKLQNDYLTILELIETAATLRRQYEIRVRECAKTIFERGSEWLDVNSDEVTRADRAVKGALESFYQRHCGSDT